MCAGILYEEGGCVLGCYMRKVGVCAGMLYEGGGCCIRKVDQVSVVLQWMSSGSVIPVDVTIGNVRCLLIYMCGQ